MAVDGAGSSDRSRAVWNPVIDKLFADVMVDHILYAKKSSGGFLSPGWYKILLEFNRRNGTSYDIMQLKNRFNVLKRMYYVVKELLTTDGFAWDEASRCVVAASAVWDNYLQSHPLAGQFRTTCFLAYEQMAIICNGSGRVGSFAKSCTSVDLKKEAEGTPSSPALSQSVADEPGSSPNVSTTPAGVEDDATSEEKEDIRTPRAKRNKPSAVRPISVFRRSDGLRVLQNDISTSLWEMIAASKYRPEEVPLGVAEWTATNADSSYSITNCVKELMKLEGIDPPLQVAASAYFRDAGVREMFMAWGKEQRLAWLDAISRPFCWGRGERWQI